MPFGGVEVPLAGSVVDMVWGCEPRQGSAVSIRWYREVRVKGQQGGGAGGEALDI